MKKYLSQVLVLLIITAGCTNEITSESLEELELKGPVKSVIPKYYEAEEKFGKISKGDEIWYGSEENYFKKFDESGNIIEQLEFNRDGTVFNRDTKTWEKGKILEENYWNDGEFQWRRIHDYDENGQKQEINMYDEEGKLDSKTMVHYDEEGKKSLEVLYSRNGEIKKVTTFSYGEGDDVTEIIDENPEGKEFVRFEYVEAPNRTIIERKLIGGVILSSDTYVYGENDEIREQNHEFMRKKWKKVFEYNDDGLVKGFTTYEEGKRPVETTFSYQLDSHNNWILRETVENNSPIEVAVREIKYYE